MSETNIFLFFSVCHSGCLFVSFSKSSFDVFKFIAVKCTSNETHLPFTSMLTKHKRHRFLKCKNFAAQNSFPSLFLCLSLSLSFSTELLAMRLFTCTRRNASKNTFKKVLTIRRASFFLFLSLVVSTFSVVFVEQRNCIKLPKIFV